MFEKGHKIRRIQRPLISGKHNKIHLETIVKHGKYVEACKGAPKSKGRDLYLEYMEKSRYLTPRQAVIAQCAQCMAWYVDGRQDCENGDCPLYLYMPYGKNRKIRIQAKKEID